MANDDYRYILSRDLKDTSRFRTEASVKNFILWVMYNPSTADSVNDDATIRRVIGFSREWGYDGLKVVNLFNRRATDPKDLKGLDYGDLIHGEEGNLHSLEVLVNALKLSDKIVLAWGGRKEVLPFEFNAGKGRMREAIDIAGAGDRVYHLGLTKEGEPKHPLYLAKDTPLQKYSDWSAT